jgi:hypothetical protein
MIDKENGTQSRRKIQQGVYQKMVVDVVWGKQGLSI